MTDQPVAPAPEPQPTPPAPTPAPEPAPVAPVAPVAPAAPPVPLVQPPDLTSPSWWQWALTTLVSLGVGVGVLVGHPFDSATADAIVPSVALVAASVATAFQVRGAHAVAVARINYLKDVHNAQIYAQVRAHQVSAGYADAA